jgi:hypothetical protein
LGASARRARCGGLARLGVLGLLVGSGHVFAIQTIKAAKKSFPLSERVDALEPAVSLDVCVGEGDGAVHAKPASVVEVGESLPNPAEVAIKRRLLFERLDVELLALLCLFLLNLPQPRRVLRRGAVGPVQEGD